MAYLAVDQDSLSSASEMWIFRFCALRYFNLFSTYSILDDLNSMISAADISMAFHNDVVQFRLKFTISLLKYFSATECGHLTSVFWLNERRTRAVGNLEILNSFHKWFKENRTKIFSCLFFRYHLFRFMF